MRGGRAVLIALLAFSIGGCITHTPLSETVMFHDPATTLVHDRQVGFGIVGTYAPSPSAVLDKAREKMPGEAHKIGDLQINPNRFSGGIYLSVFDSTGNYAISWTVGAFVAGLDASVQLWERTYMTASVSAPGQAQVYVQHRAYNSPHIGAVIGLGFRNDLYAFSVPCAGSFCLDLEYVEVRSFGVRGFGVYRAKGDTGGGMRLGLYAGYAPQLREPVLEATLTVGRF